MRYRSLAIDCGVVVSLVALNLFVIAPFLRTGFGAETWNNDYLYISMSRMFRDRPWTWNSLQYGGAPFHYVYPPLFHILVTWLPVHSLGRAYHLVSGFGYALVPAAFYVAAVQIFRARALAASLAAIQSFSPTVLYLLIPAFKGLAGHYGGAPWNFVALIAANESAHTLSLALILLVVAAAWREHWRTATLCGAAVFLINWAGAIGLLMVLAALAVERTRKLGWRGAALRIGGLAGAAYGLAAFWITPDFVYTTKLLNQVMLRHSQPDAPWNATTWMVLAGAAVLLAASLWRRMSAAAAFAMALVAISGAVVISYAAAGNYLVPLPHRYAQEFNVGLVLALGCLVQAVWKRHRALGALLLVVSAAPAVPFLLGAWSVQPRGIDPRDTSAFQIAEWLAHNAGSSRVLVAGELEGSLNIWADVPQVSGSAQGVWNYLAPAAHRQITLGCEAPGLQARLSELWLRALGVQYLVVHGAGSMEHFHWFVEPERFAAFPAVWNNGRGDTIYRVPPPDDQPAVVVDLRAMEQLGPLRATDDAAFLEKYVAWARGKRSAEIHWESPGRAGIRTELAAGEGVLVKVNYHPGWTASIGTVRPDPIGFVLLTGTGGSRTLRFGAPWGFWVGRGITAASVLLLLAGARAWIAGVAALAPALLAYGWLLLHAPATATIAEDTFRRVQPPLINAGGMVDGITSAPPPLVRGSAISIYGTGFGSAQDEVRAWVGGRPAEILYHGPHLVNLRLPPDAPPLAEITIEVNGCRGNAFLAPTLPAQ